MEPVGAVREPPSRGKSMRHNRRSIRLHGYDYFQAGVYFVTICARDRECLPCGMIVITDVVKGGSRTAPTEQRKPVGRLVGAFKTVSTKRISMPLVSPI